MNNAMAKPGILIAALLLAGAAGTAAALAWADLPVERLSIWSGQTAPTDLAVENVKTVPRGMDRAQTEVRVVNGGNSAAAGEVTVQLLDEAGNLLAEGKATVGSLAPGASATVRVALEADGLMREYESYLVSVRQA